MAKWVDVGPAGEFGPGAQKSLRVEGVPLAVFNLEGRHIAVADVCPHAGMPLGQGELCGKVLTCPFHGYAYDVESGKNVDFPDQEPPLRTFPVRTSETGVLQVNLRPGEE
jgi:nitrite reductase/ring-hydroxylating ferredoxin subunit